MRSRIELLKEAKENELPVLVSGISANPESATIESYDEHLVRVLVPEDDFTERFEEAYYRVPIGNIVFPESSVEILD